MQDVIILRCILKSISTSIGSNYTSVADFPGRMGFLIGMLLEIKIARVFVDLWCGKRHWFMFESDLLMWTLWCLFFQYSTESPLSFGHMDTEERVWVSLQNHVFWHACFFFSALESAAPEACCWNLKFHTLRTGTNCCESELQQWVTMGVRLSMFAIAVVMRLHSWPSGDQPAVWKPFVVTCGVCQGVTVLWAPRLTQRGSWAKNCWERNLGSKMRFESSIWRTSTQNTGTVQGFQGVFQETQLGKSFRFFRHLCNLQVSRPAFWWTPLEWYLALLMVGEPKTASNRREFGSDLVN